MLRTPQSQARIHRLIPLEMRDSTKDRSSTSHPEELASEYFTFDRRGNKHNVTYGPGKYEVPRHKNAGRGNVVGLSSRYRVSKETGHVEVFEPDPPSRVRAPSALGLPTSAADEVVEEVRGDQAYLSYNGVERQRNFISLSRGKRRRLSTEEHHYLSTSDSEGSQDNDESLQDSTIEQPKDGYDAFRNNPRQQRIVEFERRVRKDPEDIDAWRGLVTDQYDSTLRSSNVSQSKLETYERALKQVRSTEIRRELTLEYLREGAQHWDSHDLYERWMAITEEDMSLKLWIEYLNIRQTGVQSFNLDEWMDLAISVFDGLYDSPDPDDIITTAYLLLRILTILRQSGFVERAIALLQALFEWYCPKPDSGQRPDLNTFEASWSNEDKHFGEDPSQTSALHADLTNTISVTQRSGVERNGSSLSNWGRAEQERMLHARMPAHLLDESNWKDPFRVVVLKDFQDVFCRFICMGQTYDRVERLKDLIRAFLLFCQLPPLPNCSSDLKALYGDCSIREFRMNESKPTLSYDCVVDSLTLFTDYSLLIDMWPVPDQLSWLDLSWVRRSLREFIDRAGPEHGLPEYTVAFTLRYFPALAKQTAKSLLKKYPTSLPLCNALAMVRYRLDGLIEGAKVWSTILSMKDNFKNSEPLDTGLLWRSWMWATLEANSHSSEETLKVFAKMLEVELGLKYVDISAAVRHGRAEMELLVDNLVRQRTDEALETNVAEKAIHWIDVQALFDYLVSPTQSLADIAEFYVYACAFIESGSSSDSVQLQELLHQARGRLIHLHTTLHPLTYKPKEVIEIIHQSLAKFPTNTILLNLSRIHALPLDRLRGVLSSVTQPGSLRQVPDDAKTRPKPYTHNEPSSSITLLLHDLVTELTRSESSGSNVHSIRSAFRRALDLSQPSPATNRSNHAPASRASSTLVHSPSFWTSYMHWEASLIHLPASHPLSSSTTPALAPASPELPSPLTKQLLALRQLYLQSLSACPWSKDLHLLGFTNPVITLALKITVAPTRTSKVLVGAGKGQMTNGREYGGGGRGNGGEAGARGEEVLREIYQMMLKHGMRICQDWEGE